jgi:hypothetical protein
MEEKSIKRLNWIPPEYDLFDFDVEKRILFLEHDGDVFFKFLGSDRLYKLCSAQEFCYIDRDKRIEKVIEEETEFDIISLKKLVSLVCELPLELKTKASLLDFLRHKLKEFEIDTTLESQEKGFNKEAKSVRDFLKRWEIGFIGRYGINDHYSKVHHFDLRLEMPDGDLTDFYIAGEEAKRLPKEEKEKILEGKEIMPERSFVSFAISKHKLPKGRERIMMMRTSDHPIDYFSRPHPYEIPEGQYGAGRVELEDLGNFIVLDKDPKKAVVFINGVKYKGIYAIVYLEGKSFLLIKTKTQDPKRYIEEKGIELDISLLEKLETYEKDWINKYKKYIT